MVAKVNIRKSISKAINYNEAKVRAGTAELLLASGFGCDISELGFSDKVRRFEALNQRAEKIKYNTLHIFLSFPQEEQLPPDMLQRIVVDYMHLIGFGQQPFLVYQHHDTKNPHLHIVTNSIQADGEPINLHNIGRDVSDPARETIEQTYGLIVARGRGSRNIDIDGTPDLSRKVQEVTGSYKYSSLEELNLILAESGMTAFRGAPGSAMYTNRGLIYSRIDTAGNRTGEYIKSSDLTTRPTLDWLEKRFEINKIHKLARLTRVATRVTEALRRNPDPTATVQRLQRRKIGLRPQHDQDGKLVSFYFIDHVNKAVFSVEELGLAADPQVARLIQRQDIINTTPADIPRLQGKRPTPSSSAKSHKTVFPATQIIHSLFPDKGGQPGPAGDEPPKKKKRKKRSL